MVRKLRSAARRLVRLLTTQWYGVLRDRVTPARATVIQPVRAFGTNKSSAVARVNELEHRIAEEVAGPRERRLTEACAERTRVDRELSEQVSPSGQGTYVFPISDDTVAEACRRVAVSNPVRQDSGGRTAHALVTRTDGSRAWLKVSGLSGFNHDPCRTAEIESERLTGLAKPAVIRSAEWQEDEVHWRSILMTVASSPAAAKLPWRPPLIADIPDEWFDKLRDALQVLQRVVTPRHVYTPDGVRDLIRTYLPAGLPTEADIWRTQHCDLHWSNLTMPHLTLLDWEVWGVAPLGYGAGRLLVFSLLAPDVARELEKVFADEFSTASGQVGVLAAIAVVRKQIEGCSAPKDLEVPIASLVERIQRGPLVKY
jgi:hypothetical protein